MQPDRRRHVEALVALLFANALWGLSFPLIKAILQIHAALDPTASGWFYTVMTVAPRFLCGAVIVTAWFLLRRRRAGDTRLPRPREWTQGAGLGLFAAGGMLWQNEGLQHTAASTSAFLSQLYAVLIPLWVAVRSRRRPSAVLGVSIVLVLFGGAVLARFDPRDLHLGRGEAETLLGSLFFTGQILWLGRPDYLDNRPLAVTCVMFATEAVLFCGMALVLAPEVAALFLPLRSVPWLGCTALLTIFCTLGAFGLMNSFQPRITPTEAGLLYSIEPVFGTLLAMVLPAWFSAWAGIDYANETFTVHLLIGGTMITAANVIVQLRPAPVAAPR